MKYYFSSKSCGMCKMVKPLMEELGIKEFDIQDNEDLVKKYNIMTLPSFVNGDKVLGGAKPNDELIEFFK